MLKIVAENLQPFEKKAKLAFEQNEEALFNLLKEIENRGACAIDVNLGPIRKDKKEKVEFFIKNIERYTNLEIFLDSADPEIIKIGLESASKKVVINGFSLEEKKLNEILPLAGYYKVDIIGLVMTSNYIPSTLEEKLLIAQEMISIAEQKGVDRSQIVLDPVIIPLGWENGSLCAKSNIEFIKHLPSIFGPEIRTIVGLSNLTTKAAGGKAKDFLQSIYLSMLYNAGLSMVMLDIFNNSLLSTIKFIDTLEGRSIFTFAEFSS
ncbi:MAG: dihydropteroate synthase [Proteobacteria bacterium]|nr:dihydropteroate synthase [Pseudomonadota bacterium]